MALDATREKVRMSRVATKGAPGQKPQKQPRKARKPLPSVSKKRKAYYQSPQGKAGVEHMTCVKLQECCICGAPPPSDAHHCISGRYSARKSSDFDTIPLCIYCHRAEYPGSIHSGLASWVAKHGPDTDYIARTRNKVAEMQQSIDF